MTAKCINIIKTVLLIVLISQFFNTANAQLFEKRYQYNASTYYYPGVTACATRGNGNNIIAINQTVGYPGGAGILAELNLQGDTLWTKEFDRGTYGDCFISFIKELPTHQLFLAGSLESGFGGFWLTDSLGNILINKKVAYNTYREITLYDVDMAPDGTIFFAGSYFDLYSGGMSYYSWTVPLYGRLNSDLTLNWAKTYGSTNHTNNDNNRGAVHGIKVTPDNNLIIIGTDAWDYTHAGTFQMAKVTQSAGTVIWSRQRDRLVNSTPVSLNITPNGEIYAFTELTDNPPFGGYDFLIEKFSSSGSLKWAKTIGSGETESIKRVVFNTSNMKFVIAGNRSLGPSENRAWLCVMDTSGVPQFNRLFGEISSNNNTFNDVAIFNNHYLLGGYAYTYGAMLAQTDWNGNTGCLANTFTLQSVAHSSTFTTGIYHGGISLTITAVTTGLTHRNLTSSTTCYTCSDVLTNISITACGGYYVGGGVQTVSGLYNDTLSSYLGCDSIIVTNLTIQNPPTIANAGNNQNICLTSASLSANAPSIGTGHWTVVSGSGTFVNANNASTGINGLAPGINILRWTISNGVCTPSTDDVTITVNSPSGSLLIASACDSYTLNSQTYTTSGTFMQTLVNTVGCDSTITLNLTINNASSNSITTNACDSYILNGQSYTSTGTYTQTLINTHGCDSMLTLNLTINNATSNSITSSACDSYILNGQTYISTGTYTQTLINTHGCDSTLILNLTINNATSNSITTSACDSYILNGQTYTTSGTYTQTLINTHGCDSALTLNLTINASPTVSYSQNPSLVCINWAPFILNAGSPSGGTYSGAGVTGNMFDPFLAGAGTTIITYVYTDVNGCSGYANSPIIVDLCTDLNEKSSDDVINIYPNPTNGILILTFSKLEGIHTAQIINLLGEMVCLLSLTQQQSVIDLSSIAKGSYFIRIADEKNKVVNKKIILL